MLRSTEWFIEKEEETEWIRWGPYRTAEECNDLFESIDTPGQYRMIVVTTSTLKELEVVG